MSHNHPARPVISSPSTTTKANYQGTHIEVILLDAEVAVAIRESSAPSTTNPDAVLVRLEAILRARYPGARVLLHRTPRFAAPARVTGGPTPETVRADLEDHFGALIQRAASEFIPLSKS